MISARERGSSTFWPNPRSAGVSEPGPCRLCHNRRRRGEVARPPRSLRDPDHRLPGRLLDSIPCGNFPFCRPLRNSTIVSAPSSSTSLSHPLALFYAWHTTPKPDLPHLVWSWPYFVPNTVRRGFSLLKSVFSPLAA